jgi:hypothetical protein
MSYTILNSRGTQLTVVADGTVDNTLSIKLIGKNYAGYGELQNENLVYMLENFANTNGPNNPQTGQLWYDTANGKMRFWDGNRYRVASGCEVTATNLQPSGATQGEFWFDTVNQQVYVNNGSGYVLVGPQSVAGSGTTQMQSASVTDTNGGSHSVILAYVGGQVMYIISSSAFTLNPNIASNPTNGFSSINKGITLSGSASNVNSQFTTSDATLRFWGTSSDSDSLGGYPANAYLRSGAAGFSNTVQFSNNGYWLGDNKDILFNITGGVPTLGNIQGNTLVFQVKVNNTQVSPLTISGTTIIPDINLANIANIGSSTRQYNTIYATNFAGTASQASSVLESVSSGYRTGNTGAVQNTVAVRDNNADIFANIFQGVASSADYADLAENYLPDDETMPPGTVVKVGGNNEITRATFGDFPIGVISTNPAYLMNKSLTGGLPVALKGRVPVMCMGAISKGDQMISTGSGFARSDIGQSGNHIFAISLEDNTDEGPRLVECLVL